MSKSIGYHTRLDSDNTVKVVGGSFGGAIDQETVERLTKVHFTIAIKPSGRLVFVDREGREVRLYLHADPERTEAGKLLLVEQRKRQYEIDRRADEERQLLMMKVDDLSNDELRKLVGE